MVNNKMRQFPGHLRNSIGVLLFILGASIGNQTNSTVPPGQHVTPLTIVTTDMISMTASTSMTTIPPTAQPTSVPTDIQIVPVSTTTPPATHVPTGAPTMSPTPVVPTNTTTSPTQVSVSNTTITPTTLMPTAAPTCAPNQFRKQSSVSVCQSAAICSHSSEFQVSPATAMSNTQCRALTKCNASQYQSVAPTLTTDRICTEVQICQPGMYQTEQYTATTDRQCALACKSFYVGSTIVYAQYSVVNATATNAGVCEALVQCNSSELTVVNGTNYTNTVCKSAADTAAPTQMPTVDYIGIGLGATVFVLLIFISVAYLYAGKRRTQKNLELHEMLLCDERQAREQVAAEVAQMKKAWEILEHDLSFVKQLATGGSGTVWHAKWGHNDVAVKILKYAIDGDMNFGEDFDKEVSFMQRIRHPNLLLFYGAGKLSNKRAFLVVELMEEGSMHTLLLSERELDWRIRLNMALDVANGMKHLHAFGCIHRDLKSDNCLVGKDLHVKVGDFGNSILMEAHRSAQQVARGARRIQTTDFSSWTLDKFHTQGIGTPLWMAPELLGNTGDVYSEKIDVYSFGIVMWELATRKTPWKGEIKASGIRFMSELRKRVVDGERPSFPDDVQAECPHTYMELVHRCWEQKAARRPSFDEILQDLTVAHDNCDL
eukprot:m.451562 g.451562  ORF g.451562 m.451562 type:complete len:658 (-) comp21528_c0_seq15:124-2097(-)